MAYKNLHSLVGGDDRARKPRQLPSNRVNPRVLIAAVVAAVCAFGLLIVVAQAARDDGLPAEELASPSPFAGSLLPDGVRAPDFTLPNQDGDEVSMRELRGQPVVVTFLYTHCEDSCPPQAQQIKGALDDLGHDLPVLAIAVDPPNDTAASARDFLTEVRMTGRMQFLLGSEEDLKPVWHGFYIQPQTEDTEHQARTVLIDKEGYQRVGYPLEQATPERLEHDLRVLEAE